MKQKPNRHKLGDFMEGKGFYIVLFLCVAAIGISGYYLFSGLFQQSGGFGQEVISSVSGQADLEDKASTQTPPDPAPAEKDQDTAQVKPDPKPAEKDTTPAATPQKPQGRPIPRPSSGRWTATWSGTSAWRCSPMTPPWGIGGPTAAWTSALSWGHL